MRVQSERLPRCARMSSMRANVVDARRATALKRNVHELVIDARAGNSRSRAATLAEPGASFGLIGVRRPATRTGAPFSVGDRFTGAFRITAAARAWGAPSWLRALLDRADRAGILPWLENRLTSDHAEVIELRARNDDGNGAELRADDDDAATATHTMAYRYLADTPLAGESRYTIAPGAGAGAADVAACTLTLTFAFQEITAFAVFLLHGFGIRQHDLAVLAQAEAAARRIGARVVAHTIQSAA